MTYCIYCKADDAERVEGIPLCASCAGRFSEGPQIAPIHPEWLTKRDDSYPFCDTSKCPYWRGYCSRDPACND
jgi:hypothetical protein